MRWLRSVAAVALATAALTGCAASHSGEHTRTNPESTLVLPPGDTESPVGEWGSSEPDEAGIAFAADGSYTGNDSCNAHGGRWSEDDGVIVLSERSMTAMMCSDGRDQWIAVTRTFVVENGVLQGFDEHGNPTGSLSERS